MVDGRHILLGVTGSIAAYKAAALASTLVQQGHQVRVILTPGGAHFVTPLTFEAITGQVVASSIWDESPGSTRMGHLELARWADVVVVAPASANTVARLATGLSDDLLGAVVLSTDAALVLAPAMESNMYAHPATRANLALLRGRGAVQVGPVVGHLASGAQGEGRLAEPDEIVRALYQTLSRRHDLEGCRVLVTAGPTREPIDPVRYIGNRSSGKMGYAIAVEARQRGAGVVLISGPTELQQPNGVELVQVETAAEMLNAVRHHAPHSDVLVMAAAVADFRPATFSERKLKRSTERSISLVPTSDIAAEARALAPDAFHVGFALESHDLLASARAKLERKGQHLVIANAIDEDNNPFGSDANKVWFVGPNFEEEVPLLPKRELAGHVWNTIQRLRR